MTDEDRNEIEEMIHKIVNAEIENVKVEFESDIRDLQIDISNLEEQVGKLE